MLIVIQIKINNLGNLKIIHFQNNKDNLIKKSNINI